MDQIYLLTKNVNENVTSVLSNTFKTTKRIKLSCWDVSHKYLIFGASSGGIYIFKRNPFEFLKLIPSKDGAVTLISISPNENIVAIANEKGWITLLDDCFDGINFQFQVFTEHEGQQITALKWTNNELYCGDVIGRVSVILISNLLTKSIFQTPTAVLMSLDAPIVQLDTYSKYLLVSTKTKTFLCNTEKEQFRQIGKKLRDGTYGACFYYPPTIRDNYIPNRTIYKPMGESEDLQAENVGDVKIFCARPGFRLWQANFEGSVVFTQQYKGLKGGITEILLIDSSENAKLQMTKESTKDETMNFQILHMILNRFLVTFTKNSFCIVDPLKVSILCQYTFPVNIVDVKVIRTDLYVWCGHRKIRVISLKLLEDIIVRSLIDKQYYFCTELCIAYMDDIKRQIKSSKKLHTILILKDKLIQSGNHDMLEKIGPLMEYLNSFSTYKLTDKSKNGITIVENAHSCANSMKNGHTLAKNSESEKHTECIKEKSNIDVFKQQYKVNKTHPYVLTTSFLKLLNSHKTNEIHTLFTIFLNHIKGKDSLDISRWCQEKYLHYIAEQDLTVIDNMDSEALNYLETAYGAINENINLLCTCEYPLPSAKLKKPKYFKIGCSIFDKTLSLSVIKKVPYMYSYYFMKIDTESFESMIPLMVQFGDVAVLQKFSNKITYDSWDHILKLTLKLKQGKCINCGVEIDNVGGISWNNLGMVMVQSIGGTNTIKLLKRYSKDISHGDLDHSFYTFCIFIEAVKDKTDFQLNTGKLLENALGGKDTGIQLDHLVGNFLQTQYVNKFESSSDIIKHCGGTSNATCLICNLKLNTVVLGKPVRLNCDHVFHSLCISQSKYMCNICTLNNK